MRAFPLFAIMATVAGCTVVDASPQTAAMVGRMEARATPVPRVGEVVSYSDLANVPGNFRVLGTVAIKRDRKPWDEIDARLRAMAAERGGNGIVMHPFSRRTLGAVYSPGSGEPDPFADAQATVIQILPAA